MKDLQGRQLALKELLPLARADECRRPRHSSFVGAVVDARLPEVVGESPARCCVAVGIPCPVIAPRCADRFTEAASIVQPSVERVDHIVGANNVGDVLDGKVVSR